MTFFVVIFGPPVIYPGGQEHHNTETRLSGSAAGHVTFF
jgi:hypothetical protein